MLERQEADIQTKVEKLEELNQSLRQRDNKRRCYIGAIRSTYGFDNNKNAEATSEIID